ncbi:MAG: phosphodiester glycosidase family protein, partial [Oscillospiraceae bacterium]|nr:phosphodiester glycosidase family protein [Oscillospiraceae bacterium]
TSTRSKMDAYHLLLEPVDEDETKIILGGSIELEMVGMMESTDCGIAEDTFVLSIAEDTVYKTALEHMRDLEVGDTITVTASVERDWEDVYYACGGSDLLVEGGDVCDDFTLDTAEKSAARTAIGIKDDGTIVMYTADGSNGSAGLTLEELAERMAELGCEIALNLDGGGSTTLGAIYPGYESASTVNTPEDGELRPCANFIYLVRSTPSSAKSAKYLYLYPYHAAIMRGTAVSLNIRAVDANYMPTDVPEELTFSAMGGTITEEGIFTATTPGKKASIDVEGDGAKGSVELQVIDEPTGLTLKKEKDKNALTKLIVAGSSKTDLTAEATFYGLTVASQDSCFEWEVDEKLGTVNEQGTFRAANVSAPQTGEITVTCGDVSATAEVTVSPSDPFADMKNHWAAEYVNTLYFEGVLAGSTGSDGKAYYRPDASMTRQEFMVALMRFLQVDAAKYADTELPFDDSEKIASWALDAVKASYALEYVGGSKQGKKLYVNPTATISRQEAMVILERTQNLYDEYTDEDVLKQFSDHKNVADWARSALAAMVEEGIISGSNGKLNPTGNVKRCEVAKMLYELR